VVDFINDTCAALEQTMNGMMHGEKVSGVRSLKELWKGNRNSHSQNSDKVIGTGREPGIFL